MANVIIDLAAEFTGKNAFKQAENSTAKLGKSVVGLGRKLGLALSVTAVLAYGKASVKAAAEDQKSQKQLALALKNVGLERDAASTETYIQKLQKEFGILDQDLRPAYQRLAIATKDSQEAQRLLNLSLDISASTGKDLDSVTSALSKAYLGSNTALSKLGVGISKADLKTKSFDEVTNNLADTFKGAASTNANSLSGGLDKLTVAADNAKEIIGTGLVQAFTDLGGSGGLPKTIGYIEGLANSISDVVVYLSHLMRNVAILADGNTNIIDQIREINRLSKIDEANYLIKYSKIQSSTANAHLAQLQAQYKVTDKILNKQNKLTAAQIAANKASKEKLILDKANLALANGNDVFNIDAIQNNAALINQAEQLGKATNAAQVLAIANDVARLNVKKSMLDLEAAIASGDTKAIEAATAKLNEDLKRLSVLNGQAVKLQDIKSILESLKSRDLINLDNLDAAIAKMLELVRLQATSNKVAATPSATSVSAVQSILSGFNGTAASAVNSLTSAQQATLGGYAPFVGSNVPSQPMDFGGSGAGLGSNGTGRQVPAGVNITVNAGVGDPEAIARAVEDVIRQSYQRGTGSTGLLAV